MHSYVTKLANGNPIDDDLSTSGFLELSNSQQEQLILANNIIKNYKESLASKNTTTYKSYGHGGTYDDGTVNAPCPSALCTFGLIVGGIGLGSFGGPVGMFIGGLAGLIIGTSMKA